MERSGWIAVLTVTGVLSAAGPAWAQAMNGETSSALHGSTSNPGRSSSTTDVGNSGIGQTINRPQDNAPVSPNEVAPPPPSDQIQPATAGLGEQIRRQRPDFNDKLDKYRNDMIAREQYEKAARDRLAKINGQLMNLQDKSKVISEEQRSNIKTDLEAMIGQRDKLEDMLGGIQKGTNSDFNKNKKNIDESMKDLESKISAAEKQTNLE